MNALNELATLDGPGFAARHIGPSDAEIAEMLKGLGAETLSDFVASAVPAAIRGADLSGLPPAVSEAAAIAELREIAARNRSDIRSLIGMGYHGTHTPPVIQRNVLENPGWYTAYTPYQAEIAQGRLEALLIFQTMVTDLTGLPVANASLLDEGTAAAEAVSLALAAHKGAESHTLVVASDLHPQTLAVVRTRAEPVGISVVVAAPGDVPRWWRGRSPSRFCCNTRARRARCGTSAPRSPPPRPPAPRRSSLPTCCR